MHSLQQRFESIVRTGRVSPDPLWGHKVDAINIQIPLVASESLLNIRHAINAAADGALLEIPSECLHISVLWIVAARVDYGLPRLSVWDGIAGPVTGAFSEIAKTTEAFEIRFSDLVATDTGVLLIGEDGGELAALRTELKRRLPLPPLTENQQNIIHTTLFRYKSPLRNPEHFWRTLRAQEFDIAVAVERIEIRHEIIYPSLESKLIVGQSMGRGLTIGSSRAQGAATS